MARGRLGRMGQRGPRLAAGCSRFALTPVLSTRNTEEESPSHTT
jgi:hypothetical protein